ncbi:MAG: SH3 domain-containing protein [Oscillospiraceae bacterium]|jgi:uncharacterized protein YgiM (DUF1202 family)|nr:SH3 domain-containing protein [Oscillospiraceae bacterium]
MKNRHSLRTLCLLLSLCLLIAAAPPGYAASGSRYGRVQNPNSDQAVNVRQAADTNAAVVARALPGTELPILRTEGDWYAVDISQLPGTGAPEGYIYIEFLTISPRYGIGSGSTATVYGPLNLRVAPSTGARSMTSIPNNGSVTILIFDDAWSKVRWGGREGYVVSRYLRVQNTLPPAPNTALPSIADGANAMIRTSTGANLTLRAMGNSAGAVIATYANGSLVKVVNRGGDWSYVQAAYDAGYMYTAYLSPNVPYIDDGSITGGGGSGGGGGQVIQATVNNPRATQVLNLRASPTTASASLGQYSNGTPVRVHTLSNEWCYVEVLGRWGYMMTRYLAFGAGGSGGGNAGGGGSSGIATPGANAVVSNPNANQYLNLRVEPRTTADVLGYYYNGTPVRVLMPGTEWCRVKVDGKTGYMMTGYLRYTKTGVSPHTTVRNPSSSYVNLRSGAGENYSVLMQVPDRAAASVVIPGQSWSRVTVRKPGGGFLTGYMLNGFLVNLAGT